MISFGRKARRRSTALQQSSPNQASLPTSPRGSGQRMVLLRRAKGKATGFPLMELIITVAVIGRISAVVIPQFLNARNRADAKSKVDELVGIAKECATFNADADETATTIHQPAGGTIACGGANPPTKLDLTSRKFAASITVNCLGKTFSNATGVTIEVSGAGEMSCKQTET